VIDFHVLTMPDMRQDWLNQSVLSILDAAKQAQVPVSVRLLPGIEGHIGRARKQAFAAGTHPWVSWVDGDDWISRDAIAMLASHMDAARAVSGRGIHVHEDGRMVRASRGLVLARREDADIFDWERYPYCGTCSFQDSLGGVHVDHHGYYRRRYDSPARKLRGDAPCG